MNFYFIDDLSLFHRLFKLWQKVPIFCRVLLTRHHFLVQLMKIHVRLPVQVWRENSLTLSLQHLDYHSPCAPESNFPDLFFQVNQEVSEVRWDAIEMIRSLQLLILVDVSRDFLLVENFIPFITCQFWTHYELLQLINTETFGFTIQKML